jgi:hypothetical protein
MAVIFVFVVQMFAATLPLPLDEKRKSMSLDLFTTVYGAFW